MDARGSPNLEDKHCLRPGKFLEHPVLPARLLAVFPEPIEFVQCWPGFPPGPTRPQDCGVITGWLLQIDLGQPDHLRVVRTIVPTTSEPGHNCPGNPQRFGLPKLCGRHQPRSGVPLLSTHILQRRINLLEQGWRLLVVMDHLQ